MRRSVIALAAAVAAVLPLAAAAQTAHDEYFWLSAMNKAANVALLEAGIIDPVVARKNAAAIRALDADMVRPGARRSGDYKIVEPLLIEKGGVDVSTLHSGRSRVDIVATSRRLLQREQILQAMDALNGARASILKFTEAHKRGLTPVYTQGRQSAAVPVGHYLGAYLAAYDVEAENLRQAYELVNRSPLGAGAVATSSFPLDRNRLSGLLGFSAPMENSLYANELSIVGSGARIVGAATSGALVTGTLIADLEAQYARTYPWFALREAEGTLTSRSSSMPHKVNPSIVNDVRQQASLVIGMGETWTIRAHNVPHGMPDSKRAEPDQAIALYVTMMRQLATVFDNLGFDEAAARAEVDLEYAATPELADTLQREGKAPFRIGHEFASAIVDYGKANRIPPAKFPYRVAQRLYAEVAEKHALPSKALPLSAGEFAKVMSPDHMVAVAKGLGGPQPAEVDRMLAASRAGIDRDAAWVVRQREGLEAASRALDAAFAKTAD